MHEIELRGASKMPFKSEYKCKYCIGSFLHTHLIECSTCLLKSKSQAVTYNYNFKKVDCVV